VGLATDNLTAFAGLNGGKNLLGVTAAIGALTSVFLFFWSAGRRSPLGLASSLAALGLELYLVYLSRSAGATIALALALAAFIAIAGLSAVRPRARAVASVMLVGR